MMTVKPVLWYMCSVLLYTLNTLKKGCLGKETKKSPYGQDRLVNSGDGCVLQRAFIDPKTSTHCIRVSHNHSSSEETRDIGVAINLSET